MNICINSRIVANQITGVQRYLLEILRRLPRDSIRLVAPHSRLGGARGHLWEQAILPLRSHGHLLWSPSNTGPLTVSRHVVTIHDVVPMDHPEWMNPRFAAWYRFLTPKLVQRVSRVIAVSEFTKSRLLETTGISSDRVISIPLAVDKRFAPQDVNLAHQAISQLSLPTSRYVLSVGSLEPRKNLGRLLRAWETICHKLPDDIWLVVSGAKGKSLVFQDVPEIKTLPKRVFLTGHVPDELLPSLYAGALAFAYPSVYEGFGLPPLEAMASGTPTLVGDRTSLPEVVGDAAVQVDPFDVESIADGLFRLIEDSSLWIELKRKGLERAQQFSWDKTAEQTWQVLTEAARD